MNSKTPGIPELIDMTAASVLSAWGWPLSRENLLPYFPLHDLTPGLLSGLDAFIMWQHWVGLILDLEQDWVSLVTSPEMKNVLENSIEFFHLYAWIMFIVMPSLGS